MQPKAEREKAVRDAQESLSRDGNRLQHADDPADWNGGDGGDSPLRELRIGAAAEAVSDAIIIGITAFPLIWKILFCVRPVWQGCGMDGFDALQDRALVYGDRFWHYHDAEWYISVGVGTAIVLRRSAVDAQRAAIILGETLTMGKSDWSYAVLMIPLKSGKTYRAILGNDERFPDWLRLCGIRIE